MMTQSNKNYGYPLYQFAYIPRITKQLEQLAQLAEPEDWTYQHTPSDYPKPILFNYIHYTFMRIEQEQKIAVTPDEKFACFNTGLVTIYQEPIYMVFARNYMRDSKQKWHFKKFAKKSDNDLTKFASLPFIARYFDDSSLLVFDTRLELRANYGHIIAENRDRFPDRFRDTSIYSLQNLVKGAIESAKERAERNYKVAIPQYYHGNIQLLLPLCLHDSRQADLALVVAQHRDKDSGKASFYRASTCLTLDMAYNNARLLARPDRDWLQP